MALTPEQIAAGDVVERVAFAMWRAEAARGAPNVAKNRTPETFADEHYETREKWLGLARAALSAMPADDRAGIVS
jgi:hypothetical protein